MNTTEKPEIRHSGWITLLATGFGSGLLPKAPGTSGSALATLLAWPIAVIWGGPGLLIAGVVAFAAGIPLSNAYVRRASSKGTDPGEVVIDEFAGQWLTLLAAVPPIIAAGPDPVLFLAGFILFRIFDVFKPWPIRAVERRVKGGFGIMIDDVLAAVPAGVLLYGLAQLMGK